MVKRFFLEKDVTLEEIYKIIKQLKQNKSPGDDGILAEFYQIFGRKGICARNKL